MENEQGRDEYTSGVLDPDFGQRIAATVQAEVARSLEGLDIEVEVARSLEGLDVEAMVHAAIGKAMAKIDHKVTRAKHRAQERAHRAQERAARAAERAARHAAHKAHRVNVKIDVQDKGPDVPPKVSEEEQLSILRMLQEGTITTEQADMLLSALAA